LHSLFDRFTARVGVSAEDRENADTDSGTLTFVIEGDGQELWTGDVAPGAELTRVDVAVDGVKELSLRVRGDRQPGQRRRGRRRQGGPTAAWLDAEVHRQIAHDEDGEPRSTDAP
jgi:hypothetical protein